MTEAPVDLWRSAVDRVSLYGTEAHKTELARALRQASTALAGEAHREQLDGFTGWTLAATSSGELLALTESGEPMILRRGESTWKPCVSTVEQQRLVDAAAERLVIGPLA